MEYLTALPQQGMDAWNAWLAANPQLCAWLAALGRFVLPVLALLILTGQIRSLLRVPCDPEVWACLSLPNGGTELLTHWENILGRSGSCDVALNYPVVSRQHAALIRDETGAWTVYDLGSKRGVSVNGVQVAGQAEVRFGDVLDLGGVETVLLPVPPEERRRGKRPAGVRRPASPWPGLVLLTAFQMLCALELVVAGGKDAPAAIPGAFLCLSLVMWVYVLGMRVLRRVGFEMETIAFFLSTLSLAVTASSAPAALFKQFLALLLGLGLFLVLGVFLRDLKRVRKIRWLMAAAAIGLVSLTLAMGAAPRFGAANWLRIGSLSFQPSELAKICYIFAGSATLERLFRKRNLGLFILLTGVCLGCLALMSDFGAAAIFFVTFLVIAYLRSGDFATLALICGGGVFAVLTVLSAKPYVLRRFAAWGHVWENASAGGYQQTRTMSAAASGGLVGVGAGRGWLHRVGAADTDLVFGMLCEEWGLLVAVLAVLCICTLAVFAVRACRAGRSSFYTIAACAATSMMVFQTCLNVFGSVDILPLTGVTFPFVSNGGSAMLASWGLLAFLKATDTRPNASFAIPLPARRDERTGASLAPEAAPRREEKP